MELVDILVAVVQDDLESGTVLYSDDGLWRVEIMGENIRLSCGGESQIWERVEISSSS